MSRFVECLRTLGPVGLADVEAILDQLKQHLQAEKSFYRAEIPVFCNEEGSCERYGSADGYRLRV